MTIFDTRLGEVRTPRSSAVDVYDEALLRKGSLRLVRGDGSHELLDLDRYAGSVDATDTELCDRCVGPTLDVGCGPGRFVAALMARGVPCLGVDVAPMTVAAARAAGANVLHRSVFATLPGEGRWSRVLLLDENIGIGGRPAELLDRVRELLAPDGLALVEADPRPDRDDRGLIRVEDERGRVSRPFAWSHLGAAAITRIAAEVGLILVDGWSSRGRSFVALAPARKR
jgi:SAM-dependent methyltransferase